jgi:beta-lactamase class A
MSALPASAPSTPGRWEALVEALSGPATVSVWFGGLDGQPLAVRDEQAGHYAASTMKLPLAVAAFRQHERRLLDLDAEVPVHDRFASAADGTQFAMDVDDDQDPETWGMLGGSCSLRELTRRAVVKSGNLATNLLLEQVGVEAVGEVLRDAGCSPRTTVRRGIEDAPARQAGLDNLVTAEDLARVLGGVGNRTIAAPRTCEDVERLLAAQEHRDGIPAGLPGDTYVANKTGWVDGVTHDAAVVRPGDAAPYVLVVCTTGQLTEERAHRLIADISATAWEARPR